MISPPAFLQRGWLVPVAFIAGAALYFRLPPNWSPPLADLHVSEIALAIAAAFCLYRPSRETAIHLLQALHCPNPDQRRRLAAVVAIASGFYLFIAANVNQRPLWPRLLDEKTYTLQSRMIAHGMLWRDAHPEAEFFETFYVFDHPLYAPKYFPGAAVLYVPGVWLGFPDWVTSIIIAAVVSGLTCLIAMELFDGDGASGITASLLLLAANSIHDLATWVLAHEPVMLWSLVMIYAWLQWRSTGWRGWAMVMGGAAGWAAITRPIDALVYALPMAIVIVIDLIRIPPHGTRAGLLIDLLLAIVAAAPFLILQAEFDKKLTGHLFETPYRAYIDQYQPGDAYGGIGSNLRPQTTLQQKLDYYDYFILPLVKSYRAQGALRVFLQLRLRRILMHAIGNRLQFLLLPAGIAMVWFDRRLLLAVLPLPLFALLYMPNCSFIWYYPVIIAPAFAILTVAGTVALSRWLPSVRLILPLFIVALALGSFPELSGNFHSDWPTVQLAPVEAAIYQTVQPPALVFFTYHTSKSDFHTEPVYNLTTGWPDDEPIARAQDLGAKKDQELIAYYGSAQPERNVYVADRESCAIRSLGTAGELTSRRVATTQQ